MTHNDKYCGKCRVFKPKTEFNKRQASADGLAFNCRTCTKSYAEWHRSKYPLSPEQLAKHRLYNATYRPINRDHINEKRKRARAEIRRITAIRSKHITEDVSLAN